MKDYTHKFAFPFPNPSKMTVKIKRKRKHEPTKTKKREKEMTADYRQPQYFGKGNPRRERKGGTGGGLNQKHTSSCLRIPRKSQDLRMPGASQGRNAEWV